MRELNMEEVYQVSGGYPGDHEASGTNWEGVATTLGFAGLAVAAAPIYPVAGAVAAGAAAATGIYSAYSSY